MHASQKTEQIHCCSQGVRALGTWHPCRFQKELKKRKLTDEDYSEGPDGLRIAEINEGSGAVVTRGDSVTVCLADGTPLHQ